MGVPTISDGTEMGMRVLLSECGTKASHVATENKFADAMRAAKIMDVERKCITTPLQMHKSSERIEKNAVTIFFWQIFCGLLNIQFDVWAWHAVRAYASDAVLIMEIFFVFPTDLVWEEVRLKLDRHLVV